MNERMQAIDVLERAREELSRRLTERILAAQHEILDDAGGARYLSEIETIYDELGSRLAHVSAMLTHLMPVAEAELARVPDEAGVDLFCAESDWLTEASVSDFGSAGRLALPPPGASTLARSDLAAELRTFLRFVQRGDLSAAAARLASLFDLPAARAQRCADIFAVQAALRGELYTRVMRLKGELESGALDDARLLLYDCFGLEPLETAAVVAALAGRFGTSARRW